MKLNKILMALSAMAIVGCSSEDFNDPSVAQAIDDSRLIQLDENFILAGVGEVDNTTRTHWEWEGTPGSSALINKFLPIWKTAPAGGKKIYDYGVTSTDADLEAQAVGLCWLGNGAVGTDVYTNYEFYHFGWLNVGQTKAEFECNELTNGSTYDEITVAIGDAAGDEADETKFTLPAKSATIGLNYNSGVYKTDNKAIFGGQYIVYYPFNKDFKEAGTIPAVAETTFGDPTTTGVSTTLDTKELGKATFRYSAPVNIEGGNQAADFGLKNLSTLVQLRVALPAGDAAAGTETIDQIVLYSPSQKLLKQANLAADKIAAGQTGEDLYASTEGIKTIVANFPTAGVNLNATDGTGVNSPISAYITVLPTTVDDLVALVHSNSLKKWARVNIAATEFKAGAAKQIRIPVALTDFQAEYIAVDEASLIKARNEARTAVGLDPTAKPVISVIGDITLDGTTTGAAPDPTANQYDFNNAADANITIKGDDIIIPEDISLVVKNMTIESDIRVLGKSCCDGTQGGRLYIHGSANGTTVNNVIMEPTGVKKELTPALYDKYNPYVAYLASAPNKAIIAAGKTFDVQAGNVVVSGAVQHKGDIKIAEGAKLTVNATGDLKFVVSDNSQILNDGTIEVKGGGKFDITNISGTTTANDGNKMTNKGKFIHNVNAEVGTTVQSMNTENGEYRCKVANQNQLDDAYLQWTACNIIEIVTGGNYNMVNAVDANKHNGKYIDIEVNSTGLTTFNNPTDTNVGDELDIQVGNLTVTAGGLDVVFVGTTGAKKQRTLTVNGDMTVAAATTLTSSKGIVVKENLTVVEGAAATTLTYKAANGGLAVTKDITVSGNATFDASTEADALNITCANFYLTKVGAKGGTAKFGNRTASTHKNLEVSGTISNPEGCTFNILAATDPNLYAWVTCTKLIEGGTFSAARPRVIE